MNLGELGGSVLFVGTKKQSMDAIAEQAQRVGMPYVHHRWLGGLLTNWRTISKRIERLHELRRLRDDGQLDLLPSKERIAMLAELEKLDTNLGGVADMRRQLIRSSWTRSSWPCVGRAGAACRSSRSWTRTAIPTRPTT
jgi:ribosomal protein S2